MRTPESLGFPGVAASARTRSTCIALTTTGASLNPNLHRELWTSWASLLRAYTGAHGLNSIHHAVVEVGPEEIILRVDTRWLRFTPITMRHSDSLEITHFSLEENGTVTLDGVNEEMDLAAERLAREIMT